MAPLWPFHGNAQLSTIGVHGGPMSEPCTHRTDNPPRNDANPRNDPILPRQE